MPQHFDCHGSGRPGSECRIQRGAMHHVANWFECCLQTKSDNVRGASGLRVLSELNCPGVERLAHFRTMCKECARKCANEK